MKEYDMTESAYKNGFSACFSQVTKFMPGDTVDCTEAPGESFRGVVTDWYLNQTLPEIMYLVTDAAGEVSSHRAEELTLISGKPVSTDQIPETVELTAETPIPFVVLHADKTGAETAFRADTITLYMDGAIAAEGVGMVNVSESFAEITKNIQKAWE